MTLLIRGTVGRCYALQDVLAARAMAALDYAKAMVYGANGQSPGEFFIDYPSQRQYIDATWEIDYIQRAIGDRHNILGVHGGQAIKGQR